MATELYAHDSSYGALGQLSSHLSALDSLWENNHSGVEVSFASNAVSTGNIYGFFTGYLSLANATAATSWSNTHDLNLTSFSATTGGLTLGP